MIRVTVTGTGTDVGKTVITTGLVKLLARHGPTLAFKPYETGVQHHGIDAQALRDAAAYPNVRLSSRYRLDLPIAPGAATLENREAPLPIQTIVEEIREHLPRHHVVVEGAGGLMVPLDRTQTFLDFALQLAFPVILITPDGLGTLSHTLCAWRVACAAGLDVRAVVLNRHQERGAADVSQRTNLAVLEGFGLPLIPFGPADPGNVDQIADALAGTTLLEWLR